MKILSIKHVTLLLVTLFTFTLGYAQVGIGTTDIDASASEKQTKRINFLEQLITI